MNDVLEGLGLSEKEAGFYLQLLASGEQTAAELAKRTRESRTNTYMILERLVDEKLVEADESAPVRRYKASDPDNLKNLLNQRQQQLRSDQAALMASLPELRSIYRLAHHKPGVLYLEGIEGLRTLLEDNARVTKGTIDLIASDEAIENKEAWELLQKGAVKRSARNVTTRGLFHISNDKHWQQVKKWESKGYKVRRWGSAELPGEILIYGDKVAFTVYKPVLIVTIVTDAVIAQTFRVIFEQLWAKAKPK